MTVANDTFNVNSGDYDAKGAYLLDVLANDTDAYSGKVMVKLVSTTTTQGGKVAVDKKTNKVKYIRPAGAFAAFSDTFQYRLEDKDGNLTAIATVTINVALNP